MNSYRFEQGFTYELNLQGHGDEARTRSYGASETQLGGRLTPLIERVGDGVEVGPGLGTATIAPPEPQNFAAAPAARAAVTGPLGRRRA